MQAEDRGDDTRGAWLCGASRDLDASRQGGKSALGSLAEASGLCR